MYFNKGNAEVFLENPGTPTRLDPVTWTLYCFGKAI
jgi:hypothetical protein